MMRNVRHRRGTTVASGALGIGLIAVMLCLTGMADVRAQSVIGGFSGNYSANANKPIDITAEVLEVDDKKKIAIFRGNVSATQGDFNIKAQELTVNYTTGGAKDGTKTAANNASVLPGGGNGEINEIRANGDVILTTKDQQEARSEAAVFDVKAQLVTMLGNVRLAKGQDNIIKGSKVVVNLTEGTTRIEETGQGTGGGRISATFVPTAKTTKEK